MKLWMLMYVGLMAVVVAPGQACEQEIADAAGLSPVLLDVDASALKVDSLVHRIDI
ncbi:MAG: hypothetical protein KJO95_02490 [Gammaproteobacteria bacterium]|nr:hypothetical protein [Woeseia sp.]MBT8101806.1 hypothetical protein [Gammaproteobacteria bacterium]